jgi:hypothetical protein
MMAVIDLGRGKRNPSDLGVGADPGDPSRIPAKCDRRAGDNLDDRRRWGPVPPAIDKHPVPIMVRNVSERLTRYPDLIAVIVGPSADGKGLPCFLDTGGPPEFMVLAFIVDPFPCAGLLQIIGLVLKLRRYVFDGLPPHFDSLGPDGIPGGVPVIPRCVHNAFAGPCLSRVGQYRGTARNHLVPGVAALLEIIYTGAQGQHLNRLISHINVKGRTGLCHDVAERGRDLQNAVPVVEPGDPGGDIHLGSIGLQGDQLNLCAAVYPDPKAIGHDELSFRGSVGI